MVFDRAAAFLMVSARVATYLRFPLGLLLVSAQVDTYLLISVWAATFFNGFRLGFYVF